MKQVTLVASTNLNEDYLNIDVQTLVSDMITDSVGQFGFMLQLVTEKYYRSLVFGSSDNADSTLHPKLEITYTVPVEAEGCVTMRLGECGKDAFLYDRLPDTNYGDHVDFAAMGWTHSGSAVQVRSLVEFDLSSIPKGVTIDSAKLSLYGYTSPGNGSHSTTSGSNKSFVKRVIKSWQENTVTWNDQPSTTAINQATLSASTLANQDYLDINVTNMVTDMIADSNGAHGFMLQLESESYYRSLVFGSSDNSNTALHPQLVVCYSVDVVSVENISSDDKFDFNLYPNPASATVTIQSNLKGNLQVVVLNSVGQAISAVNSFEKSINIDVSGYSAGLYYVQVLSDSKSTIKKLVIQ